MTYTMEELAEFAAKALELRQRAHKLEMEQASLNSSVEAERHALLGLRAKILRTEAARLYALVLDAREDGTES
jgi:hypothetical protein